jgi:5-methylcytosine-specific restriction endonuclease McrA
MTEQAIIKSVHLRAELIALREKYGYSLFRQEVVALERSRLQIDKASRVPRQKFKARDYKRLYHAQRGICPLCGLGMILPLHFPGGLEIDHKNPNEAEHFNEWDNLALTHSACNRKKSSKTLEERSKETGKTTMELLK